MKACIIYDSMYGNTQKIAQAVGEGLTGEVKVVSIGEANPLRTQNMRPAHYWFSCAWWKSHTSA